MVKEHEKPDETLTRMLGLTPKNKGELSYAREWEPGLKAGIDDLIADIKRRSELPLHEEARIRKTAELVMDAHKFQTRKDDITPYFMHQLDVTKKLVNLFGVTDPLVIQVSLLHDTREDQVEIYDKLMDELYPDLSGEDKAKHLSLIHLGVRLLSKLKEPKYTEQYAHLPEPERKAKLLDEYFERMVNPHAFYDKEKTSDDLAYSPYDDVFIRKMQLVKLSDILSNTGDLIHLFRPGLELSESATNHPGRFFPEVVGVAIPNFVEASKQLTDLDKKKFYDELVYNMGKYSNLDLDDYPNATPLKEAVQKELRDWKLNELKVKYSTAI
ncbi:MAG: hypothetical protein V1744_04475 [Candidatus Altiarchaeota archaeon]